MSLTQWLKSKLEIVLEKQYWVSLNVKIFWFNFNWLVSAWGIHFNIALVLKEPTEQEDDFIVS